MKIKKGLYRHFKGNYYLVIDTAKDSETQQEMVVYRALYGNKKLWLRPLDMFNEIIERDGKTQARFAYCEEQSQVIEIAILDIVEGREKEFEKVFETAQTILSSMPGYVSHQITKCIEQANRYNLQVEWQTLEDHTVGFRESTQYQQWRKLLHGFFSDTPAVLHFRGIE